MFQCRFFQTKTQIAAKKTNTQNNGSYDFYLLQSGDISYSIHSYKSSYIIILVAERTRAGTGLGLTTLVTISHYKIVTLVTIV